MFYPRSKMFTFWLKTWQNEIKPSFWLYSRKHNSNKYKNKLSFNNFARINSVFHITTRCHTWAITCGHALPGRQTVQETWGVVQGLRTGAGCGGRLRWRQAGPVPGRFGGRSGFGERPGQWGRGGQRWGGCHLDLTRGADGGVTLRVAEAVRGGGAGRGGWQADRRRLTRGLVRHGSGLTVGSFRWDWGQLLCWKQNQQVKLNLCLWWGIRATEDF